MKPSGGSKPSDGLFFGRKGMNAAIRGALQPKLNYLGRTPSLDPLTEKLFWNLRTLFYLLKGA